MAISSGAVRLARAIEEANVRLGAAIAVAPWSIPGNADATDSLFVPLGTLLLWVTALDDFHRKADPANYPARRETDPEGITLLGLNIARNAIAHGDDMVLLVKTNSHAVPGSATFPIVLGSIPEVRWVARSVIPLPSDPKHRPRPPQQRSYDANFAGKQLGEPIARAIAFLRREAGLPV